MLRLLQHVGLLVATAVLVGVLVNCGEVSRRQSGEATDLGQTVEELRSRAEQGDASAQVSLGGRYDSGFGVPRDQAEAVKWYRMAAEQGDFRGQWSLSQMYIDGRGVSQDYTEAAKWLRMAAEQGAPPEWSYVSTVASQVELAILYQHGRGVPQDYKEAVKWYRIAAEQGWALAQYSLGLMYYEGQGFRDYTQAHKWLNLATSQARGEDEVNRYGLARDLVAKRMNPAQIAEAQRLARQWKPKTWEELKGQVTR